MDTVIDKSIQASKPGPRTNPLVPKSRTEVWIFDPYLLAALISYCDARLNHGDV
jgi:hypothetical protein